MDETNHLEMVWLGLRICWPGMLVGLIGAAIVASYIFYVPFIRYINRNEEYEWKDDPKWFFIAVGWPVAPVMMTLIGVIFFTSFVCSAIQRLGCWIGRGK